MVKVRGDDVTMDMLEQMFPVRPPQVTPRAQSFNSLVARAISQALKECPKSREDVAAAMGEILGTPTFSKSMLDRYSSEASAGAGCGHNISLERFVALVMATDATWLLDEVAKYLGCTVLENEENRLAQIGYLSQEISKLQDMLKDLEGKGPVKVSRRKNWRGS